MSVLSYIRNLLGWPDEVSTKLKRDRSNEDFSSDDDIPDSKKMKGNIVHRIMESKEINSKKPLSKVRYIPIQIERPSTSTPIEPPRRLNRNSVDKFKNIFMPRKLSQEDSHDDVTFIGSHQNKENVGKRCTHESIDLDEYENGHKSEGENEDDDDVIVLGKVPNSYPVTYYRIQNDSKKHNKVVKNHVETSIKDVGDKMKMYSLKHKTQGQNINGNISSLERRASHMENVPKHEIIELDEAENEQKEDDVIYVGKASTPRLNNHYKICKPKNNYVGLLKSNERASDNVSQKQSKFRSPVGVTKSYKKPHSPLPDWLNRKPQTRDGLSCDYFKKVYNLDAKNIYNEIIKNIAGTTKLVNDSWSLRATRREQKTSQREIFDLEKTLKNMPNSRSGVQANEFDPITVAALSSADSDVEVIPSETSSSSIKIDPVNSLKDSFKDMAVVRGDFLPTLDSRFKKKREMAQERVKELSTESQIRSKVNSEHRFLQMEQKLKLECCIPESLMKEPTPLLELPKLTSEQDKLVSKALGPGPSGQLLVEKFNLRIHRRDLQTLSGLNWLNDEVINFYMNLIQQRSTENSNLPRVYATNTFFYSKLMQSGQQGLRRWTKKVDIFAHDLIVVPVHLGVHWCLSLVDFKSKQISYLDSMGSPNTACLRALRQYLRDEHQDKKGQPFDDSQWTAECLKDIPQQMNGSDCGMFACTFAEFAARRAPFAFTQAHMPQLRRKMALEILQGKLML